MLENILVYSRTQIYEGRILVQIKTTKKLLYEWTSVTQKTPF